MQLKKEIIIASHIKLKKMKIKNLLLASLAVAAMTACSNEEEFIDNGIQTPTGEQATMRVNFTSATGKSRAVSEEGKDAGSNEESAITTATIVLDYGGNKLIVKNNLTVTNDNPNANQEVVASTPAFSVAAGSNITIYAFVNPSDKLNAEINAAKNTEDFKALQIGAQALPGNGLDYLASSIAKDDNFLMSGSKGDITITAGTDENKATINVDRVSAKLDERTDSEKNFKISESTYTVKGDKNWLVAKFVGHSYSNLVKDSYVLTNETNWTGAEPYLQVYKTDYRWIAAGITYCLENKVGGDWTEETKAKATNVHYQAQVYYATGSEENPTLEEAETFYVKVNPIYEDGNYVRDEKTIYKSWAEMRVDYNNLSETEGNAEYLAANGIIKYEDGLCYYEAAIQHAGQGCSIIRNNWYQLAVNSVKDLGWPTSTPPTPESDTKLTITANIQPWTIHKNEIDL